MEKKTCKGMSNQERIALTMHNYERFKASRFLKQTERFTMTDVGNLLRLTRQEVRQVMGHARKDGLVTDNKTTINGHVTLVFTPAGENSSAKWLKCAWGPSTKPCNGEPPEHGFYC